MVKIGYMMIFLGMVVVGLSFFVGIGDNPNVSMAISAVFSGTALMWVGGAVLDKKEGA